MDGNLFFVCFALFCFDERWTAFQPTSTKAPLMLPHKFRLKWKMRQQFSLCRWQSLGNGKVCNSFCVYSLHLDCLSSLNVAGSTWFNSSVRTWLQRLDHARILGLFLPLFLWESELDGWATPTKFTSPQSRKFLIHQWSIRAKVQWFFPRTICSLEKRLRLLSRLEPAQTWNKNAFHQIQGDKPLIVFHTCFVNLSFIKGQVHTHWLGR